MSRPPKERSAGRARRPAAPSPPAAAPSAPALPPAPAPASPAGGRPTTLTQAVADAILDAIELGVTGVGAALAAGVPPNTLWQWLRRGRKEERAGKATPFAQLAQRYTRAKGASERSLVATIRSASVGDAKRPGDWRAAAFLIERRFHQRWARHEKVRAELTGKDGTPLNPIAVIEEERRKEREAEARAEAEKAAESAGKGAAPDRRKSTRRVGARRRRARDTTCPPGADARKSASQAGGGASGGAGGGAESKPPK